MRLKNNVGEAIDISSISLSTESVPAYSCTTPPANPTGWKSGEVKDLTWTGCSGGGIIAGEKGKVLIAIRYYSIASGSGYTKEVKGEVLSTVV